ETHLHLLVYFLPCRHHRVHSRRSATATVITTITGCTSRVPCRITSPDPNQAPAIWATAIASASRHTTWPAAANSSVEVPLTVSTSALVWAVALRRL